MGSGTTGMAVPRAQDETLVFVDIFFVLKYMSKLTILTLFA